MCGSEMDLSNALRLNALKSASELGKSMAFHVDQYFGSELRWACVNAKIVGYR